MRTSANWKIKVNKIIMSQNEEYRVGIGLKLLIMQEREVEMHIKQMD